MALSPETDGAVKVGHSYEPIADRGVARRHLQTVHQYTFRIAFLDALSDHELDEVHASLHSLETFAAVNGLVLSVELVTEGLE